jgi:elongin-C
MPPPREHHQPQDEEDDDTAGVVKLISAEGFEFVVDRKAAMVSNTLRNMLTSPGRVIFTSSIPSARRPRISSIPLVFPTGGFSETRQGEVRFPEIPTNILEKICQYFYWSLHYSRFLCLLSTFDNRHLLSPFRLSPVRQ